MAIDTDLNTKAAQIRLVIGDHDEELISTQTINSILLINDSNVNKTVLDCVKAIVAHTASYIDEEVDEVRVKYSQLHKQYKELMNNLLSDPAYMLAPVSHILGGVSISQANKVRCNPDSRNTGLHQGEGGYRESTNNVPTGSFFLDD